MLKIKYLAASMLLCMAVSVGSSSAQVVSDQNVSGSASNISASQETVRLYNGFDPRGHKPGAADVSTMRAGKQFVATPNFQYFTLCGRPCWLPFMPSPKLTSGASITDNFPYERFLGNKGDKVQVVCQVTGETISNEVGHTSNIWDKVVIPKSRAIHNVGQFTITGNGTGYYAYASDMWLGNTGSHKLPCG